MDFICDPKVTHLDKEARRLAEIAREALAGCGRAWSYLRLVQRHDPRFREALGLMNLAATSTGHTSLGIYEILAEPTHRLIFARYLMGACVEALLASEQPAFRARQLLAGSLYVSFSLTAGQTRFIAREAAIRSADADVALCRGRSAMRRMLEYGSGAWPVHDLDDLIH